MRPNCLKLIALLLLPCGLAPADEQLRLDPLIVSSRQWQVGVDTYRKELLELVQQPALPDVRKLTDAYARYALCRLLNDARHVVPQGDSEQDVVQWLLANPALCRTLALAVRPEDHPGGVLAVLRILMEVTEGRPVRAPDFFVAFAVVWDRRVLAGAEASEYPPGGRQRMWRGDHPIPTYEYSPESRLRRLFVHFTRRSDRMAADLTQLPWQLLVFLVDSNVACTDREWAWKHYAGRRSYADLYGSVLYDIEYSRWRHGEPYSLENIRKRGGVCVDRTYFAANVAKACGRPALAVDGPTSTGVGHAWVLVLGGYRTQKYEWDVVGWNSKEPATYTDPQTGRRKSKEEALLLARLVRTPYLRRTVGDVAWHVADLCKADLAPERTLELLEMAARSNPFDTRVWLRLAEMMGQKQAPHGRAMGLYVYLLRRFECYNEFTRSILHLLVPLVPEDEPAKLVRLYEATFTVYKGHSKDIAALMTELGTFLQRKGKERAALITYCQLIHRERGRAQLLTRALDESEKICRNHGRVDKVIAIYEDVWRVYGQKKAGAVDEGTRTYYYRFAEKLAALYLEAGNRAKAAEYAQRCARIEKAMADRARRMQRRELR